MHGSVERSILRAAEMHTTEFIDLSFLLVHPMVRGSSTPHDMSYTFASRRVTSQKEERGNCRTDENASCCQRDSVPAFFCTP